MNLSGLLTQAVKILKSNAPEIFTGLAVSGVGATAYLAAKAATRACNTINNEAPQAPAKEQIKLVWMCYIPPVTAGALTIGCIFAASRANGARTAAAMTAYSITEKAFSEYKGKVVEQLGKGKEQALRDELAQEKVNLKPEGAKDIVIFGTGDVLCYELYTGRPFKSDMQTLKRAQNDVNAEAISGLYSTLGSFYERVGLGPTTDSEKMGWTNDRQLELLFTTVLVEERPCIAFEYNYVKPLK